MLKLLETRVTRTRSANTLPGVVVHEEGISLVYSKKDGETYVRPSTGAAGEVFAGLSYSRSTAPAMLPLVDVGTVPQTRAVKLKRVPLPGQLFVKLGDDPADIVTVDPSAAGKVRLQGDTLYFHADDLGQELYIQMMYEPSVTEARSIMGDVMPGGLSSVALGVVGVLKDAQAGTNFFDASKDWSTALGVKLGANGMLQPAADAAEAIPNVVVMNSPNAQNPFLVIAFNVA